MTMNLNELQKLTALLCPVEPRVQSQFEANPDLSLLESILSALSPDAPRGNGSLTGDDYWFGVALAVHRAFGEPGKEVFREWSMASDRYDAMNFEREWAEARKPHPKAVKLKSLKSLAARHGWIEPTGANRFTLLDRPAILSMKPLPWLVKGLLPEQGLGAIFGKSGVGKSFFVLSLVLAIAAGKPFYGKRTVKTPVTYIMLEGEAGLRNRICAWEQECGEEISPKFRAIVDPFSFANDGDVEALARLVPKGGVLVIDTLNRASSGKDENSSKDMGEVIAGMKHLQALTKGLVLIVHHSGKDTSKGLRGHSSLHAALDCAIEVEKTEGVTFWSSAKVKDGADDLRHPFSLKVLTLGIDEDKEFITSCVAVPMSPDALPERKPKGANQQVALKVLKEAADPISYEGAIKMVAEALNESDRPRARAKEALKGLQGNGFIRVDEGNIEVCRPK